MKRNLTITITALGALWVVATGVLLFYVAELAPIQALLLAFVTMDIAFLAGLALLITTNTRPWASNDPFAATADELLRPPLLRDEERRVRAGTIDDRGVVQRLSDILEQEAALHPMSDTTPPWRIDRRGDDTPQED